MRSPLRGAVSQGEEAALLRVRGNTSNYLSGKATDTDCGKC